MLFVLGAVFGFLRSIIKVKRHFLKTGRIIASAGDFLYCALCTVLFHITVFVTNYGYVRWYEFAGAFLGFVLYRIFLEDAVMKVMTGITGFATGLISGILRTVLSPFVRVLRMIYGQLNNQFRKLYGSIYWMRLRMYSRSAEKRLTALSEKGFCLSVKKSIHRKKSL